MIRRNERAHRRLLSCDRKPLGAAVRGGEKKEIDLKSRLEWEMSPDDERKHVGFTPLKVER